MGYSNCGVSCVMSWEKCLCQFRPVDGQALGVFSVTYLFHPSKFRGQGAAVRFVEAVVSHQRNRHMVRLSAESLFFVDRCLLHTVGSLASNSFGNEHHNFEKKGSFGRWVLLERVEHRTSSCEQVACAIIIGSYLP